MRCAQNARPQAMAGFGELLLPVGSSSVFPIAQRLSPSLESADFPFPPRQGPEATLQVQ